MRVLPVLPASLASGSRLALGSHCLHPWTSLIAWPRDVMSSAAESGNVVHTGGEFAAMRAPVNAVELTSTLDKGDREDAEVMIGFVVDIIAKEQEGGWLHLAEVAIAYDLATDTARVLHSRGQRDYADRRSTEVVCTADIIRGAPGRRHRVRDWKTGRQPGRVDIEESWQLKTLGLAVARVLGVDEIEIELVYVDELGTFSDVAVMGPWELEEHAGRILDLVESMARGPTPPRPGPWCVESYCPVRTVCPASKGALVAVLHEEPIVTIRDNAEARRAVELRARAEAAIDGLDAQIKEFAKREPIYLGGDKVYAWREKSKRTISVTTPEQLAAIQSVLGAYALVAVTESHSFDASITSIERAARAKLKAEGEEEGLGELRDQVIAALDAAGGVSVSTWDAPGVFKIPKAKKSRSDVSKGNQQ